MSDPTLTSEDKALLEIDQKLAELTEPDRQREAQERARLAEIDELQRRRAEAEADRGKKERVAQVADVLRQCSQAREALDSKVASWLEVLDQAHEAHREAFLAFAEVVRCRNLLGTIEAGSDEVQAVCALEGIELHTVAGHHPVITPRMCDDVPNHHLASTRIHQ
ncbi:MAG: hypothetical protein U0931_15030 [Vulcanimicrobiota bacterium]